MEEIKKAKLKDLIQDDRNLNKGTERGQELIEKSLREFGAGRSLLLDKNNRIIAGNKTHKNAEALGMDDVIIVETDGTKLVAVKRTDVDLDTKKGREMALADNATVKADLAWDTEELNAVAEDFGIDTDEWDVELDEMPVEPTETTEDDFDEEQDEVKPVAKMGDVFVLGGHRLMCGDSLNEADVLKLLNGEHAPLTFTDPPYRLATEGGGVLKAANSMKQIKQNGVDQFEPSKLKLYSETNIYSHNKPLIKDYILLAEREGKPYDLAIYKKQGLPNYAGHLMTDLEYIAVIGDQGPKKGLDFETYSKLYVGKKDADNELSYSKPVALCGKFIMLYSDKGDIVLDIFGGSGSTMIACEQLGRKCRMMELDPHYCDVIIARWEKMTGKKARKI